MKPLILGDGLFGTELQKQTDWPFISRKKDGFDFTKPETYIDLLRSFDVIINAVGNTNTYSRNRHEHWNVNFTAVCDLVDLCNATNKKICHISTDYVYANSESYADEDKTVPCHKPNWYSYCKLLADGYIQARSKDYLLIRASFKPFPFPYKGAYITQVGNFDYVSVVVDLVKKLIEHEASGIFNVGSEIKSMFDLAKKSGAIFPIVKLFDETMPSDVSMNLTKMNKFLNECIDK